MGKNKPLLWTAVLSAVGTTSAFAQIAGTPAAGEYYFKNVETGKFLGAANNWGTQASLTDHGIIFKVALNDGKYTLDSNTSNGGESHFFTGAFVDGPATNFDIIETKDKGQYIIKMGDTFVVASGNVLKADEKDETKASKWQIIPVADLKKAFETATFDNPADATFLIKGANFNRNHGENSAWKGEPAKGGDNSNMCAEVFGKTFDVYQDIEVPNGLYMLTVQGLYRNTSSWAGGTFVEGSDVVKTYLYANEASTKVPNIFDCAANAVDQNNGLGTECAVNGTTKYVPNSMSDASKAFSAGLYKSAPVYVYVNDGKLRVGIKNDDGNKAAWSIFDNFELAYVGDINIDGIRSELTQKLAVAINKANKYTEDEKLKQYAVDAAKLQAEVNKITTDNPDAYVVAANYKSGVKGNIGERIADLEAKISTASVNYEAYVAAKAYYSEGGALANLKAELDEVYEDAPEEAQAAAEATYNAACDTYKQYLDAIETAYKNGTAGEEYSKANLEKSVETLTASLQATVDGIKNGSDNDLSYANVNSYITAARSIYSAEAAKLYTLLSGAEKDGDIYVDTYTEALSELNTQKRIIDNIEKTNKQQWTDKQANAETQAEHKAALDAAEAEIKKVYTEYLAKVGTAEDPADGTWRGNYVAACADVNSLTKRLADDVTDQYVIDAEKKTVREDVKAFYAGAVKTIENSIEALQANVDAANKAHTIDAATAPFNIEKYGEDKAAIEKAIADLKAKVEKSVGEWNANDNTKKAIAAVQTAYNEAKAGKKDGYTGVDNLTSDNKAYATKGRFAASETVITDAITALSNAAAEAYKVDGSGTAAGFFATVANDKTDEEGKVTLLGTSSISSKISDYKANADDALAAYNKIAAALASYDELLNGKDIPAQGKEGEEGYVAASHKDGLKDIIKKGTFGGDVTINGKYDGKTYNKAVEEIEKRIDDVKDNLGKALAEQDVKHKDALEAVDTDANLAFEITGLSSKYAENEESWNKEQLAQAKARLLEEADSRVKGIKLDEEYTSAAYGKKAAELNKTRLEIKAELDVLSSEIAEASEEGKDDAEAIALLATVIEKLDGTKDKQGITARNNKLVEDAKKAKTEFEADQKALKELNDQVGYLNAYLNGGKSGKVDYKGVAATDGSTRFTAEISSVNGLINAVKGEIAISGTNETVRVDSKDVAEVKDDKGNVTTAAKDGYTKRLGNIEKQIANLLVLAGNEAANDKANTEYSKALADAKIDDAISAAKKDLADEKVCTGTASTFYLGELEKYENEFAKIKKEADVAYKAKVKSNLEGAIKDNEKYTDTSKNMAAAKDGLVKRLNDVKANITGLKALAEANETEHNEQLEAAKTARDEWQKVFDTVTGSEASTAHAAAIAKLSEIDKNIKALDKTIADSFGKGASETDKATIEAGLSKITGDIKTLGVGWNDEYKAALAADNQTRYESFSSAYGELVAAYQTETALVNKLSKLSYAKSKYATDLLIKITGEGGIYSKIDEIRQIRKEADASYKATAASELWDGDKINEAKAKDLQAEIENLSSQYSDEVNRVAKMTYNNESQNVSSLYNAALSDMQTKLHIDSKAAAAHLADVKSILDEAKAVVDEKDFAYTLDNTILPAFATVEDMIDADKAAAAVAEWNSAISSADDLAAEEIAAIKAFNVDANNELKYSKDYEEFVETSINAAEAAWDEIESDNKYADYNEAWNELNNFISTLEERKVGEKQEGENTVDIMETHTLKYWDAYDAEKNYLDYDAFLNGLKTTVNDLQSKLDIAGEFATSLVVEHEMKSEMDNAQHKVDGLRNMVENWVNTAYNQRKFKRECETAERQIEALYSSSIKKEGAAMGVVIGNLYKDFDLAVAKDIENEEIDKYKDIIKGYESMNDSINNSYFVGIILGYDEETGTPIYKQNENKVNITATKEATHAAYVKLETAVGETKSALTEIFDGAAMANAELAVNKAVDELNAWTGALQAKLDECDEPATDNSYKVVKDASQEAVDGINASVEVVKADLAAAKDAKTLLIYVDNLVKSVENLKDESLESDVEYVNGVYVGNKDAKTRLNAELDEYVAALNKVDEAAAAYEHQWKFNMEVSDEDGNIVKVFDNYREYLKYQIEQDIASVRESVNGRYERMGLNSGSSLYPSDVDRITSSTTSMEKQLAGYNQRATVSDVRGVVDNANLIWGNIWNRHNGRFYPSEEVANELLNQYNGISGNVNDLSNYADNAYYSGSATTDIDGNEFKDEEGNVISKSYMELYPSIMAKAAEYKVVADQLAKDVMDKSCKYGDLDNNDEINVNDYNYVRNIIIGKIEISADDMRYLAADVNHDGKVDIADVTRMANYVMTGNFDGENEYSRAAKKHPSLIPEVDETNSLSLSAAGNGARQTITVSVADTKNFVGAQMNMVLPAGVTVVSETCDGHEVVSNDVDGIHRILVSDLENSTFTDNTVVTVEVEVSGDYKGGSVMVSDAVFADAAGRKVVLGGASIDGTTGIAELTFGEKVMSKVYSIGGQLMDGLKKGYNVIVNPDGSAKKVLKK